MGVPTLPEFCGVLARLAAIMTKRFRREAQALPPAADAELRARLQNYDR
jgi:hypothetical protein